MKTTILVQEEQQFTRQAVRTTVNILAVLLLVSSAIAIVYENKIGKDAVSLFCLSFLVLAIIGYVLDKAVLTTQVREDGVYVKFSPFHRRFQIYSWESIETLYIRTYDGFREFGGWGVKVALTGICFTVSGDVGIQIVLANNTRILIGTNQAELFADQLLKMGKLDFPSDSIFRP